MNGTALGEGLCWMGNELAGGGGDVNSFLCKSGGARGVLRCPVRQYVRYCRFNLRSSLRLTACKLRLRLAICVRILSML